MPANAGQSAAMARVRACKTGSVRMLEERSTRKVHRSSTLETGAISTTRPAKAIIRYLNQTQQAGRITRSVWWNVATREEPSGVAAVPLSGEITPQSGPLAPTRRAHRFLHTR